MDRWKKTLPESGGGSSRGRALKTALAVTRLTREQRRQAEGNTRFRQWQVQGAERVLVTRLQRVVGLIMKSIYAWPWLQPSASLMFNLSVRSHSQEVSWSWWVRVAGLHYHLSRISPMV